MAPRKDRCHSPVARAGLLRRAAGKHITSEMDGGWFRMHLLVSLGGVFSRGPGEGRTVLIHFVHLHFSWR